MDHVTMDHVTSRDYLHIEQGLVPVYQKHLWQEYQVILKHKGVLSTDCSEVTNVYTHHC